ncbi:hypothetical protein PVAND_016902 [Polypedilum vanderplanki]|uniref:BTB domain-containing protein n=1 Tax=Polypedilum vanderplanki TaxID=319348 RepID=A0A9J6BHE6_POLVA|nr:hypothetical protein PVAND_016902 [Polypedilum vanderplanki]
MDPKSKLIISDCLYHTFSTPSNKIERYTCTIIEVNGPVKESRDYSKHLDGKCDNDVEIVRFMRTKNLTKIPNGISEVFPNIQTLIINDCKVSQINLNALENLKELLVQHTPITFLGADAFKNLKSLEILSFYDTKLTTIDEKVFDNLQKLKAVYMLKNLTINAAFASTNSLWPDESEIYTKVPTIEEFKKIIESRSPCDAVCSDIKNLLANNDYKDFTITIKESNYHGIDCTEKCCNEIIKVHKFLIAARCPKLIEMIEENSDEKNLNFIDIPSHAFKRVVEYFYNGIFPSPVNDPLLKMKDLLTVAEKLEIKDLIEFVKNKENDCPKNEKKLDLKNDEKLKENEVKSPANIQENLIENSESNQENKVFENVPSSVNIYKNDDKKTENEIQKPLPTQITLIYRKSLKKQTDDVKDITDDFVKIEFEDQFEIIDDFYDEVCSHD